MSGSIGFVRYPILSAILCRMQKKTGHLTTSGLENWSRWQDLNLRPFGPERRFHYPILPWSILLHLLSSGFHRIENFLMRCIKGCTFALSVFGALAVFQTVNVVFGKSAQIATMSFTVPMKFSFGQLLTFKKSIDNFAQHLNHREITISFVWNFIETIIVVEIQ